MLPPRLPEGIIPPGTQAQAPQAGGQPPDAPQQQAPPQAAPPTGPAPSGPVTAGEGQPQEMQSPADPTSYNTPGDPSKISSESQQIVTRAMEILHHPSTRDKVVNDLKTSSDPVQAVANQATIIMHKMDSMARSEGQELDYGARIKGGQGVIKEVGDISANIGNPLTPEDTELAYGISVQKYLDDEIKAGNIDQKELQQSVTGGMKGLNEDQFNKVNNDVKRFAGIAEKHAATNR